jgi:hypothetical protein
MIRLTKRICATAAVAVCALWMSGCTQAVAPVRTLPEHVRRIYVREFKNQSRVFGAQAPLTLAVTDEFILDGRLDVVPSERADVRLEGRIKDFRDVTHGASGDEFPLINMMEMVCTVDLWDPYDTDRVAPMARYTVPAAIMYVPDPRRSMSETETEARNRLYATMAKNIVAAVLTGAPQPLKAIEQRGIQRYQERNSPGKHEPVLTEPRFPKLPDPRTGKTQ